MKVFVGHIQKKNRNRKEENVIYEDIAGANYEVYFENSPHYVMYPL